MTTIDAERKAFEETFTELSDGVAKAVLERRGDGQYASIATNFAWKGWLARAQAERGVDEVIAAIDRAAQEYCVYEYGLPTHDIKFMDAARKAIFGPPQPPKENGDE